MVAVNARVIANPPASKLLAAQGGGCFYCGRTLTLPKFDKRGNPTIYGPDTITRDHLRPYSAGGRLPLNKVFACRECNQRKGAAPPTALDVEKARNLYRNLNAPWFAIG